MDVVLNDLFDMSTLHNLDCFSIDAKAFNQILKTNKIQRYNECSSVDPAIDIDLKKLICSSDDLMNPAYFCS